MIEFFIPFRTCFVQGGTFVLSRRLYANDQRRGIVSSVLLVGPIHELLAGGLRGIVEYDLPKCILRKLLKPVRAE
jgi:hypothetical protein